MEVASPNKPLESVSIRVSKSTKLRLQQKALERKEAKSKVATRGVNHKNLVFNAARKWASPLDESYEAESPQKSPIKKKKSSDDFPPKKAPVKKKSTASVGDNGPPVKPRKKGSSRGEDQEQVSRPDDNTGKLGSMLDEMAKKKPAKKRGARTVASMPVPSNTGRNRERSESPDESRISRSSEPVKKKAPRKKVTSAVEPSSEKPMKKKGASGSVKKRRSQTRSKNSVNEEETKIVEASMREHDNQGKLGNMLDDAARIRPKRKGARSVASAPIPTTPRKKGSSKRGSRATMEGSRRRSRAADMEDSVSEERVPPAKHKPRRTKSADDADMGEESGDIYVDDRPIRKGSKRPESGATASTHQGDSTSTEHDAGRMDRPGRVSKVKPNRSASVPSRGYVPSPRREEGDDRRAAMARMKRNSGIQPRTEAAEQQPADPLARAHSMMLHREMTRRGKANSLSDLVQYKESEIHSTSYFASNHVLVNRERMKRGLRPLTRNIQMDDLARKSAERMADTAGVSSLQTTYIGNVLRGQSIRAVHRATMQNKDGRERHNLLNPYFQEFGVGTCKGEDGMLYVCQLFSERLELTCFDAES